MSYMLRVTHFIIEQVRKIRERKINPFKYQRSLSFIIIASGVRTQNLPSFQFFVTQSVYNNEIKTCFNKIAIFIIKNYKHKHVQVEK